MMWAATRRATLNEPTRLMLSVSAKTSRGNGLPSFPTVCERCTRESALSQSGRALLRRRAAHLARHADTTAMHYSANLLALPLDIDGFDGLLDVLLAPHIALAEDDTVLEQLGDLLARFFVQVEYCGNGGQPELSEKALRAGSPAT
jgi:hypothetical protein